jgi:two-component system KDP operon response regulator KdpE
MTPDSNAMRSPSDDTCRVLAVDDDPEVLETLGRILGAPEFEVFTATTGAEGLEACSEVNPHLVLLDVGLPDVLGTEVLRRLRASGFRRPVVMLSAMGSESDVVEGLESGAAAYLTKPFRPGEVVAWIRAALRTAGSGTGAPGTEGPLELDIDHRRVRRTDDGREVRLTPTEMLLLSTIHRAKGALVDRATLLREVWEMDFDPGTTLVEVHLSNLRGKLRELDADGVIHNVRGEGYRYVPGEA